MDLRTLNVDDARIKETFGAAVLESGAHIIEIVKCEKAVTQSGATYLNFEFKVNGGTRYTTLWLSSVDKDTNAIVENEYNSRRLKQLLILLKIEPKTLTEVPTDKNWVVTIPQIKGTVGAVLEVIPAESTKPKENGQQYPIVNIVSFYIIRTLQTIKEFTEGAKAETVEAECKKLAEKVYTPYNTGVTPTQDKPKTNKFNVDTTNDLSPDDLPF